MILGSLAGGFTGMDLIWLIPAAYLYTMVNYIYYNRMAQKAKISPRTYYMNMPPKECDNCGDLFYLKRSRKIEKQRFCNISCRKEYKSSIKYAEEKFHSRINKPSSGCWEWTGAKNSFGYGLIEIGNEKVRAHRFSYEMFKGSIEEDMVICHSCDNPSCVNPDHLFKGTKKDNTQDMIRKGRARKGDIRKTYGEKHKLAKLNVLQAIEIKNDNRMHKTIAKQYGISKSLVANIKKGIAWKKRIEDYFLYQQ